MNSSKELSTPKSLFNKKYSSDAVRTYSIMISTSKTRKKKLVNIEDCLSELKIQELIALNKPFKTNKTNNLK